MTSFRFSKWDGSQQFSPQSADKLFDELSQYLTEYGEEVLESMQDWEETNP
jgi:Ca-activated chloride channel family protein